MTVAVALNGFASYLIKKGLIDNKTAEDLIQQAQQKQLSFIIYLAKQQILNSRILANAVVDFFNLPFKNLASCDAKNFPHGIIDQKTIKHHLILPIEKNESHLHVAIIDPSCVTILDEIKFRTGLTIQTSIVEYPALIENIDIYLNQNHDYLIHVEEDDQQIIRYVDQVLTQAIKENASDIHFENYEKYSRVRMRIDGILYDRFNPSFSASQRIISRLKVLANLDIAEKRLPQDGRFTFKNEEISRDCRISTCPTLYGEKVVLRILDNSEQSLNIDELGFELEQKQLFLQAIQQPQGMILVTGPTGSGKSLTLYSALNLLNSDDKNVCSVEDPVEIQIPGINQVNIQPKIGLTFSTSLRTFLRQDPDVIMVGEIRDLETAEIAVKAAHTGHLVFSTLHTNSAAETLTRLLNMGIASFNIASALNLVIAQRLLRRLCPHCKIQKHYANSILLEQGFNSAELNNLILYTAQGCEQCTKGYKGRLGIFEFLQINAEISTLILNHAPATEIHKKAKILGMLSLRQNALNKIRQGLTSLEEVNLILGHIK